MHKHTPFFTTEQDRITDKMSTGTVEKAGGRVGIVGTGHRARVCLNSLLPSLHSLLYFTLHINTHFSTTPSFYPRSLHHCRYGDHVSAIARPVLPELQLTIQLYTTAISARPSSQLVALCDLNESRMQVHNDLLKELGKPEAKTYHAVSCLIHYILLS